MESASLNFTNHTSIVVPQGGIVNTGSCLTVR